MDKTDLNKNRAQRAPRSSLLAPRGFTLVELLVVITIIGILASLITVAAIGALKKAQETRIKAELNQIATAVDDSKNITTASHRIVRRMQADQSMKPRFSMI